MLNKTQCHQGVAGFFGAIAIVWLATSPAFAFTCDDVRHLTSAQQNYYAKLFHIGAAERRQIYVACYVNYRAVQTRVANR